MLDVKVGDEILVKIRVNHISGTGRYYNYNEDGFTASRSIIHPDDVIEIIVPPVKVGDVFRHIRTHTNYKVEAIVNPPSGSLQLHTLCVVSVDNILQIHNKKTAELLDRYSYERVT